jgi:hypothetical protein
MTNGSADQAEVAGERRLTEEAASWGRYLAVVYAASEEAYELSEEFAWRRLCRDLERVGKRIGDDVTDGAP